MNHSIRFFDDQFRQRAERLLNPFEQTALPYLNGQVLDYGCGLGNLAVAAARRGCDVLALDASPAAIDHLRRVAGSEGLPIRAVEADLRRYELQEDFDAVVSVGLLMFFDCATAAEQLQMLQARTRPGGVAVINVLVLGTTYLDMFDPGDHCLLAAEAVEAAFDGWERLESLRQDFDAPEGTVKSFITVVARKPGGGPAQAVTRAQ